MSSFPHSEYEKRVSNLAKARPAVPIVQLSPSTQAEISHRATTHSRWVQMQADGYWGRYCTATYPF